MDGEENRRPIHGILRKRFYCFLKECEWRSGGGNHKELYRPLWGWARRKGLLE